MGLHWKNPSNLLKIWEGTRLGGEVFWWILKFLEGLGPSWAELGWILRPLGGFRRVLGATLGHVVGRVGTFWGVL